MRFLHFLLKIFKMQGRNLFVGSFGMTAIFSIFQNMIKLIRTRIKVYFDMCPKRFVFPQVKHFIYFQKTIRLLPQRRVDQIHWNFACCSIMLRGISKKKYKFSQTLFSKWYKTTFWVQCFLEILEIMPRWSYFFISFKGAYNSNDNKRIPYLIKLNFKRLRFRCWLSKRCGFTNK